MKTLDEVIKAMDWCTDLDQSGCNVCPYADSDQILCFKEDALYYLKIYQGYLLGKEISDAFDEAFTEMYNPPLTWDELKQMEGKPVWFEYDWNNIHYKGWLLLDRYCDGFIRDIKDDWALSEKNMNMWKAYRKERE